MKEFDLKKAKSGAPVCTRNGRKARIMCFDVKDDIYPILALITHHNSREGSMFYTIKGRRVNEFIDDDDDLMMADIPTIRHEGWMNICYNFDGPEVANYHIYNSKEDAGDGCPDDFHTVKIEWEDEK